MKTYETRGLIILDQTFEMYFEVVFQISISIVSRPFCLIITSLVYYRSTVNYNNCIFSVNLNIILYIPKIIK